MDELITFECTTKCFLVQQEANSELNFEDLNVAKLSFLKLIYGTSLVKIAKEINRVFLKNAKLKWFEKIVKIKSREICQPQNRDMNVSRKFYGRM